MAEICTFSPAYGQGVIVTPAAASGSVKVGLNSRSLCITNLGSSICYVRVTGGASVATIADYPLMPGTQASISKDMAADTVSYISVDGTSLHIMPGEGI